MQALSTDQIRRFARGALSVVEESGLIRFARFPEEVRAHYHGMGEGRAIRSDCTPGVVLAFETDASWISLEAHVAEGARSFGFADIYMDGHFVAFAEDEESTGRIAGVVELPPAEDAPRRVELYLPHCRTTRLESLALPDDATCRPVPGRPRWLALGDSITQGMNAVHPSLIWPAVAARALGLHVHNAGVGGAVFDERTLMQPPLDEPDMITVAYGINDFNAGHDASDAAPYLRRLRGLYPDVAIAVLEPTYSPREGFDREPKPNDAGLTLAEFRAQLREVVDGFEGMSCLRADVILPPVPHFAPDGVHPDTTGHIVMGTNLARSLRMHIS
jgi:lysophospholipase L1-like esterase